MSMTGCLTLRFNMSKGPNNYYCRKDKLGGFWNGAESKLQLVGSEDFMILAQLLEDPCTYLITSHIICFLSYVC